MAVKIWIFATLMFVGFAAAFYILTPVYFDIGAALKSTGDSIVTDPTGVTMIDNAYTVLSHMWGWVAVLGVGFVLVWAYTYSTKKDTESYIQTP